jgi:simple sugar transport system ATP-binding protein
MPSRLLLLDDPFQGVDVGARRDLIAAIRSGRQDSATLIADIVAVMRSQAIAGLYDLRLGHSSSLLAAISAVEATEVADLEGFAA